MANESRSSTLMRVGHPNNTKRRFFCIYYKISHGVGTEKLSNLIICKVSLQNFKVKDILLLSTGL